LHPLLDCKLYEGRAWLAWNLALKGAQPVFAETIEKAQQQGTCHAAVFLTGQTYFANNMTPLFLTPLPLSVLYLHRQLWKDQGLVLTWKSSLIR
jgi:hypothetical protein